MNPCLMLTACGWHSSPESTRRRNVEIQNVMLISKTQCLHRAQIAEPGVEEEEEEEEEEKRLVY